MKGKLLLFPLALCSTVSTAGTFQVAFESSFNDTLPKNTYYIDKDMNKGLVHTPVISYSLHRTVEGIAPTTLKVKLSNKFDSTVIEYFTASTTKQLSSMSSYTLELGTLSQYRGIYDYFDDFYNPSASAPQGVYNQNAMYSFLNQYTGAAGTLKSFITDSTYLSLNAGIGYPRELSEEYASRFAFGQDSSYTKVDASNDLLKTVQLSIGQYNWEGFINYTTLSTAVTPKQNLTQLEQYKIATNAPSTATFLYVGKYDVSIARIGLSVEKPTYGVGFEGYRLHNAGQKKAPLLNKKVETNSEGWYLYTRYYATAKVTPYFIYTTASSGGEADVDKYIGLKYYPTVDRKHLVFLELHDVYAPSWISPVTATEANITVGHYRKHFNVFNIKYLLRF